MKFWRKYKAKKELRKKLEKARFINFYGKKIDLSLGRIKEVQTYIKVVEELDGIFTYEVLNYYIILIYDNFSRKYLSYGRLGSMRDRDIDELRNFINSDKFTQYLNNYENLKREYEQLL